MPAASLISSLRSQCNRGEARGMSISSSGVMSTFTFLSLHILFLPSVAPQGWGDPWIKLSADCEKENKCDLSVDETSGELIIPESSAFDQNLETLLAELNFAPGDDLFVECNQQCGNNDDDLILNVTLDANGGKTQVKMMGKLDYDNPPSTNIRKRQKFFFMLGVEKPSDCSSSPGACRFIFVELKNIIDERPSFVGEWGVTNFNLPDITENENKTIVTLHGHDNDFQNGDLELRLSSNYGVFSLTKLADNSWDLSVAGLDYDLGRKSYSLELQLLKPPDNYGLDNVVKTTLFANVIDLPDLDPLWEAQCGYEERNEEVPAGQETFFQIKAVDQDIGVNSTIKYTLIEEQDWKWFDLVLLEDGNVNVTNKEQIDREAIEASNPGGMLKFVIRAEELDDAGMASNTTCRVRIKDIDDNNPQFKDARTEEAVEFHAWVKEDSPIGSPFQFCHKDKFADGVCLQENVVTPNAFDVDQYDESFNDFKLDIISENADGIFGITPNMIIGSLNFFVSSNTTTENQLLNYEIQTDVNFTIRATPTNPEGNGEYTDKVVQIHIIDINDCEPAFTEENYTVTIEETIVNQPLDIPISSTDEDATENFGKSGHIYSIVKDSTLAQRLTIDNKTGVISVGPDRLFDFEESMSPCSGPNCTVRVQVKDCCAGRCCTGTDLPKTAEAIVLINVINVNDEKPEITNAQECKRTLRNDIAQGELIVKLNGTDKDNNNFTMAIVQGSSSNQSILEYFKLSEEGELTLIQALDEDKAEVEDSRFTFTVMIEDNNKEPEGPGRLSSTYPCEFIIEDINSESPVFTFPNTSDDSSRTWIDEDNPTSVNGNLLDMADGKEIQIHATDSDVNEDNRRVSYKWQSNNPEGYTDYFGLDESLNC